MKLRILLFITCGLFLLAVPAAAVPVAVFPLQDFSAGNNDVDLEMTAILVEALKQDGNKIIDVDNVIAFMATNRIRTVGQIETFDAFRARTQLGAGFALVGTVTQRKEKPDPTLAMVLSLVRTSDARTIWTYAGSITAATDRKILGIGEAASSYDLEPYLLDEILGQWPRQRINETPQIGALDVDTISIKPGKIQPGENVYCLVNLRDKWAENMTPDFFFKVADQVYPATMSDGGRTIAGSWPVGQDDGRFTVYLTLEWKQYKRTELVRLGDYVVDGRPPLVEVQLKGGTYYEGRQVFNKKVVVVPNLIVPKPLERWRLSINYKTDLGDNHYVGDMTGYGRLPESYVWTGRGYYGDGTYEFTIEVWDDTGNTAKSSTTGEYYRSLPRADLALAEKEQDVILDVTYSGKVPLRYWRIEMWTNEGRLISESEGRELPVQIEFERPRDAEGKEITGFVFLEDVLGKMSRENIQTLLPELNKAKKPAKEKKTGVSESWVDDF